MREIDEAVETLDKNSEVVESTEINGNTEITQPEEVDVAEEIQAEEVDVTTEVDIAELIQADGDVESIEGVEEIDVSMLMPTEIQPESVAARKLPFYAWLSVAAVVMSVIAVVLSVLAASGVIRGDRYVERVSVNRMMATKIQNDLEKRLMSSDKADEIRFRAVNISVELNGNKKNYSKIDDIGENDRVTAEIVFFPQDSVKEFAKDAQTVLKIMKKQGIRYDEIFFTAKDTFTDIRAELSGKFSMDATVEEILAVTFYFGEFKEENR